MVPVELHAKTVIIRLEQMPFTDATGMQTVNRLRLR